MLKVVKRDFLFYSVTEFHKRHVQNTGVKLSHFIPLVEQLIISGDLVPIGYVKFIKPSLNIQSIHTAKILVVTEAYLLLNLPLLTELDLILRFLNKLHDRTLKQY